jgi:hypothetical protein
MGENVRHLLPHGAIARPHYLFSSFVAGIAVVIPIIAYFMFL